MATENTVTCPSNCASVPPEASYDYCNATTGAGEINKLYIAAESAADLTDWTDLAEWNSRLSQDGADADVIRYLNVIMEKPAEEGEMINLGGGFKKPTKKTFTLTGGIVDINDTNHDFMRKMACGGNYKLWYSTEEYMFGGNAAVNATITMTEIIDKERTGQYYFKVDIEWEAFQPPARSTNIFA